MKVFVLNIEGEPLMPTTPARARKMLKADRAKVVKRTPFTIQLKERTKEYKQEIILGVDAGSKIVGMSAVIDKEELYSSETVLRNDIVDLLATRKACRNNRRGRKTRYRQARFLNRKKGKGWLAPSVRHKIDSHLKLVSEVHKILPVTKIIVETASFDTQKLKNPEISGKEYQQGEQLGFWNIREYVLFRDNHTCQHCKGKLKDKILNVHHLESRKTGGDSPNNLITLCETCHKAYHRGKIDLKQKRGISFRDATFMGIMRWAFYKKLKVLYCDVSMTFGYITKNTRITNDLPKEHRIDALCITGNPLVKQSDVWYYQKFVRKNNRQLHKMNFKNGVRRKNKAEYKVFGFKLFDKVLYENKEYFVFSRRKSGIFLIKDLQDNHTERTYRKLKLLEQSDGLLTERRINTLSYCGCYGDW